MPQATPELRAKFPGHDGEAWAVLKKNFTDKAGLITKRNAAYQPTDREFDAIDYLCDEWDYGYAA